MSVYVPEDRRRTGIGAQLVRAAELEAARLGVATMYLFTADRQGFYASLGWAVHEQAVHAGQAVTIMHRRLGGTQPVPV